MASPAGRRCIFLRQQIAEVSASFDCRFRVSSDRLTDDPRALLAASATGKQDDRCLHYSDRNTAGRVTAVASLAR